MHQTVEYILGGVLVAQGLQSPDPVIPALAGGLILLNAATVKGAPLSAFRLFPRQMHRVLDLVVIALIIVAAVRPVVDVDPGARVVMGGIAAVLAFVWLQTTFAEKAKKTRAPITAENGRSDEVGRLAGRAVANGVNFARQFRKK
jgi:hypothetical protein